jgi:hypothetical protein
MRSPAFSSGVARFTTYVETTSHCRAFVLPVRAPGETPPPPLRREAGPRLVAVRPHLPRTPGRGMLRALSLIVGGPRQTRPPPSRRDLSLGWMPFATEPNARKHSKRRIRSRPSLNLQKRVKPPIASFLAGHLTTAAASPPGKRLRFVSWPQLRCSRNDKPYESIALPGFPPQAARLKSKTSGIHERLSELLCASDRRVCDTS